MDTPKVAPSSGGVEQKVEEKYQKNNSSCSIIVILQHVQQAHILHPTLKVIEKAVWYQC